MRTLTLFQGMNEGEKYALGAKRGNTLSFKFCYEARELLCQRYIRYWCYVIDTQLQEEEAEDIPVVCEFW